MDDLDRGFAWAGDADFEVDIRSAASELGILAPTLGAQAAQPDGADALLSARLAAGQLSKSDGYVDLGLTDGRPSLEPLESVAAVATSSPQPGKHGIEH
jgi:hypothetical protein